jgi:outer membrane lipoprotein SlyB
MNMRKAIVAAGVVAGLGAMSAADVASAYPYHHRHYRHYDSGCRYQKHRSGAIGAVTGAIGGGILGSALSHGNGRAALLGAGAGALTGHALARGSVHCR